MLQVSLDTSFVISFADPARPRHSVAVEYFRYCSAQQIPMWISVIAAGEFEVGQRVSDLPLQNFRVQPYNLLHAIKAAELYRALREDATATEQEKRVVVINDLKIIAQAEEERIPVILTEDENTLYRIADRLRSQTKVEVRALLLKGGFTPGRLANPAQGEFPLAPR